MKVILVANACKWASWPAKIDAIKAFYAPLVDLEIDIKYTDFENIPIGTYPGTVTEFHPTGPVDVAGMDLEINQTWFNENIGPIITGYDIAIFQAANVAATGLPWGVKFEELNGTWCCQTFATMETANYYLPGVNGGAGVDIGDLATNLIEHEIAHALYSISGQPDRTHEFFYANQFTRVLTDIVLPNASALTKLYQQLIADLQSELGIYKSQQSTADMNTPPVTSENPDTLLPWENVIGSADNRHNVRVLCDLAGLTFNDKNIITACIHVESDFYPLAEGKPNQNGTHDWGICQFNDGSLHGVPLWIGQGAAFPSTQYVLDNPEACVKLMIAEYKAGHINWWTSYSSGAYKEYMPSALSS